MDSKAATLLLPIINDFLFQLEGRIGGATKSYDNNKFQERWKELVESSKEKGLKRNDLKEAVSEIQVKIQKLIKSEMGIKESSVNKTKSVKNIVFESLNEVLSSDNGELTPEEFTSMVRELVELDNAEEATSRLKEIFNEHPYLHGELGETEGHDKYVEGMDLFLGHYFPEASKEEKEVRANRPKTPAPVRKEIDRSNYADPEEIKELLISAIQKSKTLKEAEKEIRKVIQKYPYVDEELGEIEGRDYYAGIIPALNAAYYEKF